MSKRAKSVPKFNFSAVVAPLVVRTKNQSNGNYETCKLHVTRQKVGVQYIVGPPPKSWGTSLPRSPRLLRLWLLRRTETTTTDAAAVVSDNGEQLSRRIDKLAWRAKDIVPLIPVPFLSFTPRFPLSPPPLSTSIYLRMRVSLLSNLFISSSRPPTALRGPTRNPVASRFQLAEIVWLLGDRKRSSGRLWQWESGGHFQAMVNVAGTGQDWKAMWGAVYFFVLTLPSWFRGKSL